MTEGRRFRSHDFIEHLIGQLPGLSMEQRDDLQACHGILVSELGVKSLAGQRVLYDFANACAEADRVQRCQLAAAESDLLIAAASIFRKLDFDEPTTKEQEREIAEQAYKYKTEPSFREVTHQRLQKAAYLPDAIEVEASRLSSITAALYTRLQIAASRKQNQALKSLHELLKLVKITKGGAA
jgi:hypothetical protein